MEDMVHQLGVRDRLNYELPRSGEAVLWTAPF